MDGAIKRMFRVLICENHLNKFVNMFKYIEISETIHEYLVEIKQENS